MFALIAIYGLQAPKRAAGCRRLRGGDRGHHDVGRAICGSRIAVPWLAAGPGAQGLTSAPSVIMGLGAIASYILFAAGWTLFGIASVRARVFPLPISIAIVLGGIAGYRALLAPWGMPLGLALVVLGIWIVKTGGRRTERLRVRSIESLHDS